MYQDELRALKNSGRFRERRVQDTSLLDFGSNDYLGLSSNKENLKAAFELLLSFETFAPKASMLVNGYHQLHKNLEILLASINNFEDGLLVGSGFLANLVLIESLVRKSDMLFIDEEYHASGILATRLLGQNVRFFNHNSIEDLAFKYKNSNFKRAIICVEGVYSMSGDLAKKEIIDFAINNGALLVIDEAHSNGVLGEHLLGILDFYNITTRENIVKMGTFGKAYGSYGAYILASCEIIDFLVNRGKGFIYSTALSLFDTALAYVNISYIQNNTKELKWRLDKNREILKNIWNKELDSLIFAIDVGENKKVMEIQSYLRERGFFIGAIRTPTVKSAILRVILRLGNEEEKSKEMLSVLKEKLC